jgi:hypothetical protein
MFCLDDFIKKEIKEKLVVIILSKMGKYPLTDFDTLSMKEKRIANEIVNEYVRKLPVLRDEWEKKLTDDFNLVCKEEIFNNPKIDYTQTIFKQRPIDEFDPIRETDKLSILK